jgi:hypothetical protein
MRECPLDSRFILATLSLACALPLIGCGEDDGIGQRFPVSGTVTYNGEPLKTGMVNFYPEDTTTGRPASGPIQEDGTYQLTTQRPNDGAMGGKYKVAITAFDVDESKMASPAQGGTADQAVVAQAKRTNLIPLKYTGTSSSGLTATVGPGLSTFDFKLVGTMTEADQAPFGGAAKKKARPKKH